MSTFTFLARDGESRPGELGSRRCPEISMDVVLVERVSVASLGLARACGRFKNGAHHPAPLPRNGADKLDGRKNCPTASRQATRGRTSVALDSIADIRAGMLNFGSAAVADGARWRTYSR